MRVWAQTASLLICAALNIGSLRERLAKLEAGSKDIGSLRKPHRRHFGCGSWSCKNALAEALTCRDLGEVAIHGHFPDVAAFRLLAPLMRIPAVLGGSPTADSRMSVVTMP
jgi:hypothetical protein